MNDKGYVRNSKHKNTQFNKNYIEYLKSTSCVNTTSGKIAGLINLLAQASNSRVDIAVE